MVIILKGSLTIRACCLIIITGILLSGCSGNKTKIGDNLPKSTAVLLSEPIAVTEQAVTVANSGAKSLILYPKTGRFILREGDRTTYESNPYEMVEDPIAIDVWKNNLRSQLIVKFCNANGNNSDSVNSYTYCSLKDNYKAYKIENGFAGVYYFEKQGITVTMLVTLENNALKVTVPTDKIKVENKSFLVTGIEVLPFFSAQKQSEDGFLFVPDRNGGLIDCDGKKNNASYAVTMYSENYALTKDRKLNSSDHAIVPVFGAKRAEGSFLAVITEGDAVATVNASTAGFKTDYYNVYAEFRLREFDYFYLKDWSGNTNTNIIVDKNEITGGDLSVIYYLLKENDGIYEMAEAYRQYLTEYSGFTKSEGSNEALVLTAYGAVLKSKPILGIPMQVVQPLTDYADALKIVSELQKETKQKVTLRYSYATKAAVNKKSEDNSAFYRSLGSKKEFSALQKALGEENLFIEINPLLTKKSNLAFWSLSSVVKSLIGTPAYYYRYDKASGLPDNRTRLMMNNPLRVAEAVEKAEKENALKTSCYAGIGEILYSDFSTNNYSNLQQTASTYTKALDAFSAQKTMITGGNAYTWGKADIICDLPENGSGNGMISQEVPFVQTVLNGFKQYCAIPINLSANPTKAFLKAIETQSALSFAVIGDNTEDIADTELNYLCGASYKGWQDDIVLMVKKHSEAMKQLKGKTPVDYTVAQNGVTTVTYKDNTKLYVNYSEHEVTVDGKTIAKQDYLITE